MTWEDITIDKYLAIVKAIEQQKKDIENGQFIEALFVTDIYKAAKGLSDSDLNDIPATEYGNLIKEIEFIQQPPKPRLSDKVKVGEIEYTIPINIRDVTTAQYIDYSETLKNDPENIAMMCAIFCVPTGKKYNEGYSVSELADFFYDAFPIVDAIGISFFFNQLLKSYVEATLTSLKRSMKKEMSKRKMKKDPEKVEALRQSINALSKIGGLI